MAGDEIQWRTDRDHGGGTLGFEARNLDSLRSQELMHDVVFPDFDGET